MESRTCDLDAGEQTQFREAFHDNLDLVLEVLEAMRCESNHASDPTSAMFLDGVHQALHAFGRLRESLPSLAPSFLRPVRSKSFDDHTLGRPS